jgi:nitroreductase
LLLAAYEKGYGTCWMTAPMVAAPEIEKILNVRDSLKLCAVIPMGVPAKDSIKPPKKSLQEVLEVIE